MARNRQRSKQRQAERRARRLQEQGDGPSRADIPGVTPEPVAPVDGPGPPGTDADHLEAGAPPEQLGQSDFFLEHDEAALDDDEADRLAEEEEAYEEIEDWELDASDDAVAAHGAGEAGYAVRGR